MMTIFNTPLENGLRLIILMDVFQKPKTLDMLYSIDFITVYGETFGITNANLNGDNQYKFSEFASRRELVRLALRELVLNGFARPVQMKDGIGFLMTGNGRAYCAELESDYAQEYKAAAVEAVIKYGKQSERNIMSIINKISAESLRKEYL